MPFGIGAGRIWGAPRKSALAGRRGSSREVLLRALAGRWAMQGAAEGPDQGPKWGFKEMRLSALVGNSSVWMNYRSVP